MKAPLNPELSRVRDEFAAVALAHLLRQLHFDAAMDIEDPYVAVYRQRVAVHAYLMAEAMIEVRGKDLSKIQEKK